MKTKSNKAIVLTCYRKIIRDLDLSLFDAYVSADYIQHSPTVKHGRAGLLEMLQFLKTIPKPPERAVSPIVRVIADGDLVAVHLDIKFMGRRSAVIDLMRIKDGKLAEHWDAVELQSEQETGPVTMTNGITIIDDSADSNNNKRLVSDFLRVLFQNPDPTALGKYLAADYLEHNTANSSAIKRGQIVKVHRIIGEGDFVVAQCECQNQGKTFARYSIFRVEDDMIVEHWSVEQGVPNVMAHNNGMF